MASAATKTHRCLRNTGRRVWVEHADNTNSVGLLWNQTQIKGGTLGSNPAHFETTQSKVHQTLHRCRTDAEKQNY